MLLLPKPQLVLPPIHNWAATPVSATPGTTVAAHATINTEGAWTQIFAAATVTYDVYGITLIIVNDNVNAGVCRNLYDIGIGGAGAETLKIPDLLNSAVGVASAACREFSLPIFIPRGTRISMRKQSDVTVKTSSCTMRLHGGGGVPPWTCFAGCDSYGTDPATSGGMVHAAGSTGTYSTWANFTKATVDQPLTRDYGAIMPMVGWGSDTVGANLVYYLQIGIASVMFDQYMFATSASEAITNIFPSILVPHKWTSGTQIMMRATASAAPDTDLEYGFLAFY